jgi:hypothetical protein
MYELSPVWQALGYRKHNGKENHMNDEIEVTSLDALIEEIMNEQGLTFEEAKEWFEEYVMEASDEM